MAVLLYMPWCKIDLAYPAAAGKPRIINQIANELPGAG